MIDAQLMLQPEAAIAATANGPTLDLGKGTGQFAPQQPGQPVTAPVTVSAIATAGGTYAAKLQQSPDGLAWTDVSLPVQLTGVGTFWCKGFVTANYVRLVTTVTPSATAGAPAPSVTLAAYLNPQRAD